MSESNLVRETKFSILFSALNKTEKPDRHKEINQLKLCKKSSSPNLSKIDNELN